jgi:hypothetical protein
MNKQIDDGGSAFPYSIDHNAITVKDFTGMTLRDYFAAAALQGVICHNGCGALTDEDSSRIAYEYADEMIKARKGGDQP